MNSLLADIILVLHALFVAFVVLSLPLIFVGAWRKWMWVRAPSFRWCHLLAIGFVVVQAWLGQMCPLTIWENQLRFAAGEQGYDRGFIADWLHTFLFYTAPDWVFVLLYTTFGVLVLLAWWKVPPGK